MATNYTTKTAALRATKADMRQVQVSKKIEIGKSGSGTTISDDKVVTKELYVDKDGTSTNVLTLIDEAQTAAAEAAGINVKRDLNADYDSADEGEVLETKVKGMNFYGEYVNVVDNGDGTINLYFGQNNNPAEMTSVTSPSGSAMYVYADAGTDYSIGTLTAGSSYSHCQTGGTETIYANGSGTIITIPNTTSTVKVEALASDSTTIASAETEVIDGTSTTKTASNGGIAISVSEIHLNTSDDAASGYTPGFIRCKVSATITNATVMPNGGYYKLKMSIGSKSFTAGTAMFVYNADTTAPSIGSVTATYSTTSTKQVSGITYDSAAKVDLSVTDITGTQQMVTKDQNRITISDNSNSYLADFGTIALGALTVTSGDKTKNNAVYSYSGSKSFTSNAPVKMSGTISVTPHGYNGAVTASKKDATFAGTNYCWTTTTSDTNAKANFSTDGSRLPYVVLADTDGNVTGLTISSDTYSSSTSIDDTATAPYNKQLLIQDEYLMYPTQDVTGTYTSSNCTGTRYWVKKIATGTSTDAKTTFTVTGSNLNASGVKIWAVCSNTDATATAGEKSLLINALGSAGGFAKSVSATSLSVEIPGGQMTCTPASCFYLVVQLPQGSTAKLGPITVA